MSNELLIERLGRARPDEQSGPIGVYASYFFPPLLLIMVFLLVLRLYLPSPLDTIAHWLSALTAGVILAALVLMALTTAWLKSRLAGSIATGLAFVGWISWAVFLPKAPIPGLPQETSARITTLLALLIPLFVAPPVLLLGLYLASGYLLPVALKGGARRQVFSCLMDYLFGQHYPFYVMTDEPREEDKLVRRGEGDPFSTLARGPGIILTRCDHVVAVSDGLRFKGVQGPGVIFTGRADRPLRTIDLRPQVRAFEFHALTQDGIQIEVPAVVIFQIDPGGRQPQLGEPLPYRKGAAFKAVHAQEMEPPHEGEGRKKRGWDELPQLIGMRILQNILAGYRFDGLYDPYEVEKVPPRQRVIEEFRKQLERELQPLGIRLLGGGVGNIRPVRQEVLQRRIQNWQADWARKVLLKQARSQAERIQRIEHARAEARTDLIMSLGERLAELDQTDAQVSPKEIVAEFLDILERWALRPGLQRYIPRGTVQEMRHMRESLKG